MGERLDDIGFGGYSLLQNTDQFCYGVDAVLLADFSVATPEDRIAELGSGNGIIPLILYHKYKAEKIVGLEKQYEAYELACRNVENNDLKAFISFVHGDVVNVKDLFQPGEFSLVVTNPPYQQKGTGPISPSCAKETARHETTAALEDFIDAAGYLLSPKGRLCMVHRPSRLVDIITLCRKSCLEPKRIKFVAPSPGMSPNIVLLECVKGGGKELSVEPTLFVRDQQGEYSEALNTIYGRK